MEVKLANCLTTTAHDEHSAAAPGEPRLLSSHHILWHPVPEGCRQGLQIREQLVVRRFGLRHGPHDMSEVREACMSTPGQHASHTAMLLWLRRSDAMPPAQQTAFQVRNLPRDVFPPQLPQHCGPYQSWWMLRLFRILPTTGTRNPVISPCTIADSHTAQVRRLMHKTLHP